MNGLAISLLVASLVAGLAAPMLGCAVAWWYIRRRVKRELSNLATVKRLLHFSFGPLCQAKPCVWVVPQAEEYAGRGVLVATSDVFAALLGGEEADEADDLVDEVSRRILDREIN